MPSACLAAAFLLTALPSPEPAPTVPTKARADRLHRPDAVERLAATPYRDEILAAAAISGVDPLLVAAVIHVESGFRPHAVSHRGAVGLMQLMPVTARQYGVRNPSDPDANIHAGSRHLAYLIDRFEGDLSLALAAYNAGVGNVLRHGGVPPFPETRGYVRKVMARYESLNGAAA